MQCCTEYQALRVAGLEAAEARGRGGRRQAVRVSGHMERGAGGLPGGGGNSRRRSRLHMSYEQHLMTTDSFLVFVVEQLKGCS